MITICSIRDAKPEEHDETWAIVRSYKNASPKVRQVADLSPSWDLFSKYRRFVSESRWGADAFEGTYLPQFINEMQSERARKLIDACVKQTGMAKTSVCSVIVQTKACVTEVSLQAYCRGMGAMSEA